MTLTLYDLSVPILVRALENLTLVLKKGEAWCEENQIDKAKLLGSRLAPDMLPLPFQIQNATVKCRDMIMSIGGGTDQELPPDDTLTSFPGLYARISKTLEILKAAKPEEFQPPGYKFTAFVVTDVNFVALDYLQKLIIPNFFFHCTTAYAILRMSGVQVGKADYIGRSTLASW